MSARRPIPSQTQQNQLKASDPALSAWVSAHAGSGKTHVLSQRVVRLLLARVPPSRILCLTYTKAAAANMAARVFDRLAGWALMDDATLDRAVLETTGKILDSSEREFARRLFARAVETPGGLKIQTIHAFCERTLHSFPFEANVPASFRILDDIERAELLAEARKDALERAGHESSPLFESVGEVARDASGASFASLVSELMGFCAALPSGEDEAAYVRDLRKRLGLDEIETLATIEAQMIASSGRWPGLARRLRQGGARDAGLGDRLDQAATLAPQSACIDDYLLVFFTQEGKPRGGGKPMLTKALCQADPDLLAELEAERERLTPLVDKRKTAAAFARSLALARLGGAVLAEYERRKNRHGLFDFDDLIERMRALLRRSNPSWVLYKLDQQIDHILLDEAQDTSAPQWEILQAIANEFAQGETVRSRTFFAVGDEKQSIFSFQGAAPKKFDEMRRDFKRRFDAARLPLEPIRLHLSFRSSPVILACVDAVFGHEDHRRGLSFDADEPAPKHEALKSDAPGLVEIWEAIGASKAEQPIDWRLPLDYVAESDPAASIARKVAGKIKYLLAPENGEWVEGPEGPRRVSPGDVLILVRRRDAFFEVMIRALKEQQIAVAGADRLDLMNHIAVMDLCALGKAALLREDDLTLATVLKSPLVGLTDDDLIALAPRRAGALIEALAASRDETHKAAARQFDDWSRNARRLSPFEFYMRVLGPERGRKKLVARLGVEANDAIDEFLRLALAYERDEAGALTGFLASVERLDVSIKRDMEAAGDAVRVMTAHAAKGLEAKIVFLPDTCGGPSGRHDPRIFALHDDADVDAASLVWSPRMDTDPAAVARARDAERQADQEEYRRLLYVALTRAEERLYVAGYHGKNGPAAGCWFEMIKAALEPLYERRPDPDTPGATILRSPDAPAPIALPRAAPSLAKLGIPDFARTPAKIETPPAPPLRPSNALAGAEEAAPFVPAALTRRDGDLLLIGRLTHALLQYLPQAPRERRREAALRFLTRRARGLEASRLDQIAGAALRVVDSERFAPLFGAQSMAEVEIAATIETPRGSRHIVGRIDRIAVMGEAVFIADFKTGTPRATPSLQELRQLALYRAAVASLYPGKNLRCAIVWTQDASTVEPSEKELLRALAEIE
jgi:ATP-dependent helicase/nuclease subunit A